MPERSRVTRDGNADGNGNGAIGAFGTMDQGKLYSLYESDPTPEVEFLRFLAQSCALPDPPAVLDVGCGPGRMLLPLGRLGWTVTGLEPDPDYVADAIRRAESKPNVGVRAGGFADIDADCCTYDMIAAVDGPFSYLLEYEERRQAVQRAAAGLRPGGVLFLHFSNFWWILRNYREPRKRRMEVEGITVERSAFHDIDFHAGRFTHHDVFRWIEPDGTRRTTTKKHEMAMFGLPEVEQLTKEAGLIDLRTYNDYSDRAPAAVRGQRVMLSARKPT